MPRQSIKKLNYIAYSDALKEQETDLRNDYKAYRKFIFQHPELAVDVAATLKAHFFEWFLGCGKEHADYHGLSAQYDKRGVMAFFDLLSQFRHHNQHGRAVNVEAFRQNFRHYVIAKLELVPMITPVPVIANASELAHHPVPPIRTRSLFSRFLTAIGHFFQALFSCFGGQQASHEESQHAVEPRHQRASSTTGYLAARGIKAVAPDVSSSISVSDVRVDPVSEDIQLDDLTTKSTVVLTRKSW